MNIQELSVGDWVTTDIVHLTVEGDDLTNAFVKQTQKPISIISLLGEDELIFAKIDDELIGGYGTIYLKAENTSPIPLTQEILEKNGLEFIDDGNDAVIFLCSDMFWARLCVGDCFWSIGVHSEDRLDAVTCNVKYVHQLQHALRLAGVGKEIKL